MAGSGRRDPDRPGSTDLAGWSARAFAFRRGNLRARGLLVAASEGARKPRPKLDLVRATGLSDPERAGIPGPGSVGRGHDRGLSTGGYFDDPGRGLAGPKDVRPGLRVHIGDVLRFLGASHRLLPDGSDRRLLPPGLAGGRWAGDAIPGTSRTSARRHHGPRRRSGPAVQVQRLSRGGNRDRFADPGGSASARGTRS